MKRKTIVYNAGFQSFLSIGAAFILLNTLFLWSSYHSFRAFFISSNDSRVHSMISYFEYNIKSYYEDLQSEAKHSVFIKAVMDPDNAGYYLPDYMDEMDIRNLKGDFILITFDGIVIYSTLPKYPAGLSHPDLYQLITSAIEGRNILMLKDSRAVFISVVQYQNLTEGYLIFMSPISEIYASNRFILDKKISKSSISVLYEGKAIIEEDVNLKESFSLSYPLDILPLEIVISTPTAIIQDTVKEQVFNIALISLISIFLMSILLAILISRKITDPLRQFEAAIKKVGSSYWEEIKLDDKVPLEIVFLSQEFNDMQKCIRKKAEELETLNRELRQTMSRLDDTHLRMLQSEKMASIGLLAAGVAHEINNPTGFISTNLTTMTEYMEVFNKIFNNLDDLKKQADEKNYSGVDDILEEIDEISQQEDLPYLREDCINLLKESSDGTRRIKDIVQRLSTFARPETRDFVEGDVNTAINDALKLAVNELKYNCEIIKELEELPRIRCRIDQLTQVFINLFVNSSHAIVDHGIIRINSRYRNGSIYVEIQDSGKGIPPEDIPRLFDPFFTTKEIGRGTGLGLSITKEIIDSHYGTIEVKSIVGEGTSFLIQLPVKIPQRKGVHNG